MHLTCIVKSGTCKKFYCYLICFNTYKYCPETHSRKNRTY